MEHDPIDVPSARKISGKAQAGKDMEDYFGFEVSHHHTFDETKSLFSVIFVRFDRQDEDEQIDDDHEISKSTIQLINFED